MKNQNSRFNSVEEVAIAMALNDPAPGTNPEWDLLTEAEKGILRRIGQPPRSVSDLPVLCNALIATVTQFSNARLNSVGPARLCRCGRVMPTNGNDEILPHNRLIGPEAGQPCKFA